jgi:hypothetical protein
MSDDRRCYKLTDENGETGAEYRRVRWGENVTHVPTSPGQGALCGPGWIHFYDDPILGLLLNRIHASFQKPRVWEARWNGSRKDDRGLKAGATSLTTVREITRELPEITTEMRVRFAILVAGQVYGDASWQEWAASWLAGEDRSANAAADAANAADAAADAADAANAAYAAAYAAANAAYAAYAAANAAYAAARDSALSDYCEGVVQILLKMKVPGAKWLALTEAA